MNDAKKRSRLEIIYDIMVALRDKKGPIVPTHLLYKSNLSHDRLKGYLEELIGKHFIEEVSDKRGRKRYQLTEEGYKFLEGFQQLSEFTRSFGL
jgi:predicted transcriptional regulator